MAVLVGFVLSALALVSTVYAAVNTVPNLRYYNGEKTFEFRGTPTTWYRAWEICDDAGGHIGIPRSQEDMDTMVRMVKVSGSNSTYIFVGECDISKEGEFRTIFLEPVNATGYNEWVPGRPDNYGGHQNCLSFQASDGLYDDLECDAQVHYFCIYPGASQGSGGGNCCCNRA